MGRKTSGSAFSLFSFQDIITSVTAILILIMLLLALELTRQRSTAAAGDPGATQKRLERIAADLEASVARLQDAVAAAREAEWDRRPREEWEQLARQATERLDVARLRRDDADSTLRAAERVRVEAESRLAAREADRNLLEKLQRRVAEDQTEADRLEQENDAERDRQAKRRQEIEERPKSGTELVFNRPADASRKPWLVELSSEGVVVVLLGTNSRESLGAALNPGGPFAAWITRLQPAGDYCLLLMRPSASPTLLHDVESALSSESIPYGIDFIGEDQVVMDGSAPPRQGDR